MHLIPGLWQRKTGRFGRKIKNPPAVKAISVKTNPDREEIALTCVRPFVKTRISQFHY